jgi:Tfp pilus assembly protein PilV
MDVRLSTRNGFSLAELLVALGLFAVCILTVLALSISIARSNQEGEDTGVAGTVANGLVEELVDRVRADQPPGLKADFWDNDYWEEGTFLNNGTEYQYKISGSTVQDTGGVDIGNLAPGNRLKKVDIVVYWWDSETTDRQGYGRLEMRNTRLVSEGET